MRFRLLLVLAVMVVGCEGSIILHDEIEACEQLCKNNNGIYSMDPLDRDEYCRCLTGAKFSHFFVESRAKEVACAR